MMMSDQFIPLYSALIVGALVAGGVAVWWGWKLRQGDLHLLGPRPEAQDPQSYVQPDDQDLPPIAH